MKYIAMMSIKLNNFSQIGNSLQLTTMEASAE